MKIVIIGANGQLGSDLCRVFSKNNHVIPLDHMQIEITNYSGTKELLETIRPELVINTAAFHNVPKCEEDPLKAYEVNALGSLNLAKLSVLIGFTLVHYSTDYVFDGLNQKPYVEDDLPNPLNVYATTKVAGEHYIKSYAVKYFIIRVSGIYGEVPCRAKGGNFITNIIKASKEKPVIRVVNDEILTPTPTFEIASFTHNILQESNYGLYHLSCEGECSWYDFTKVIFDKLNIKTPLESCSVKDFPVTVKRPFYSVMENNRLKEIGCDPMPYWKDSLIQHLNTIYKN